jgi:hypothetical protein
MQKIIDQILSLLKEKLDGKVKVFYQGNPANLGMSMLPLVYAEASQSDTQVSATGMDQVIHTVTIGLIFDKRSEMGKESTANVGNKKIIEIMEGRNDDGSYAEDSVTGILRKNFTLNESVHNQVLSLLYGLSKKGEVVYDEARITFRVSELIPVPSRI